MQVSLYLAGDLTLPEVKVEHRLTLSDEEDALGDVCAARGGRIAVEALCHLRDEQLGRQSAARKNELPRAGNIPIRGELDRSINEKVRPTLEVLCDTLPDVFFPSQQAIKAAVHVEVQLNALARKLRPLLHFAVATGGIKLNEAPILQKITNALVHFIRSVLEPLVDLFDDSAFFIQIEHDAHHHRLAVRPP